MCMTSAGKMKEDSVRPETLLFARMLATGVAPAVSRTALTKSCAFVAAVAHALLTAASSSVVAGRVISLMLVMLAARSFQTLRRACESCRILSRPVYMVLKADLIEVTSLRVDSRASKSAWVR